MLLKPTILLPVGCSYVWIVDLFTMVWMGDILIFKFNLQFLSLSIQYLTRGVNVSH